MINFLHAPFPQVILEASRGVGASISKSFTLQILLRKKTYTCWINSIIHDISPSLENGHLK